MIVNYGGYDSLGIAYNTLADTYFLVIHGRAPATFPQEDVGAEISSAGVAGVEFDVTATGNKLGNFNPRIAASSTRNEWMMVTSSGFAVASAQRIKTLAAGGGPPPPPPPPPPPIDLSAAGAPNGSWFLAEGAESGTATGFHTFYLVANEHDDPVDARVWFAGDDGTLKYRAFTVAARSRTNDQPGQRGERRLRRDLPVDDAGSRHLRRAIDLLGSRTSRAAPASRRSRACPPPGTSPRARAAASCSTTSSSSSTRCRRRRR